ncbi:unnamed protein product, partial [Ectocarpus sp. 8 AP-2014]
MAPPPLLKSLCMYSCIVQPDMAQLRGQRRYRTATDNELANIWTSVRPGLALDATAWYSGRVPRSEKANSQKQRLTRLWIMKRQATPRIFNPLQRATLADHPALETTLTLNCSAVTSPLTQGQSQQETNPPTTTTLPCPPILDLRLKEAFIGSCVSYV